MRKLGLSLLCLAITGCITTHATLVDPTATRYAATTGSRGRSASTAIAMGTARSIT